MLLVQSVAPEPDLRAMHRGLLVAQAHCFSHGITGWQDAILRIHDNGVDALDVYLRALESGDLQAKVRGALWWDRNRGLDQVDELIERRDRARGWAPRFRADSIKVMLDGTCANFTALLTQPYHDGHGHVTENHGMRLVPFDRLASAAKALDAAGFQMHFHALGDQAVRDALDAIRSYRVLPCSGITLRTCRLCSRRTRIVSRRSGDREPPAAVGSERCVHGGPDYSVPRSSAT